MSPTTASTYWRHVEIGWGPGWRRKTRPVRTHWSSHFVSGKVATVHQKNTIIEDDFSAQSNICRSDIHWKVIEMSRRHSRSRQATKLSVLRLDLILAAVDVLVSCDRILFGVLQVHRCLRRPGNNNNNAAGLLAVERRRRLLKNYSFAKLWDQKWQHLLGNKFIVTGVDRNKKSVNELILPMQSATVIQVHKRQTTGTACNGRKGHIQCREKVCFSCVYSQTAISHHCNLFLLHRTLDSWIRSRTGSYPHATWFQEAMWNPV